MWHIFVASKRREWRRVAGVDGVCCLVAMRTSSAQSYEAGLTQLAPKWRKALGRGRKLKHSRLQFRLYQRQPREVARLCHELCGGRPAKDRVVLWGDGSFGSTFHGYAAAPNKGLRDALSPHGLEIPIVDEYHISQHTACCVAKSRYTVQRQQPSRKKLQALTRSGLNKKAIEKVVSRKAQQTGLLCCHPPPAAPSSTTTLRLPSRRTATVARRIRGRTGPAAPTCGACSLTTCSPVSSRSASPVRIGLQRQCQQQQRQQQQPPP